MTPLQAKGCGFGIALLLLGTAGALAQQVRAVHGAYLLASPPPLQGLTGDTLHIYRPTEKGALAVGTAVVDELRAGEAICKIVTELAPHRVQVGDWLVAADGRPPRGPAVAVPRMAGSLVVAVRGGFALVAGLSDSVAPGTLLEVEQAGKGGSLPIGTLRVFSLHLPYSVASIVQEDSLARICPGDMVRPMTVTGQARPSNNRPRVAKVKDGYLFIEGLPEDWPAPATLQVVRESPEKRRVLTTVRLLLRKGDRGVATPMGKKPIGHVRAGDVLVLLQDLPESKEADLDTYFSGSYRPRR